MEDGEFESSPVFRGMPRADDGTTCTWCLIRAIREPESLSLQRSDSKLSPDPRYTKLCPLEVAVSTLYHAADGYHGMDRTSISLGGSTRRGPWEGRTDPRLLLATKAAVKPEAARLHGANREVVVSRNDCLQARCTMLRCVERDLCVIHTRVVRYSHDVVREHLSKLPNPRGV